MHHQRLRILLLHAVDQAVLHFRQAPRHRQQSGRLGHHQQLGIGVQHRDRLLRRRVIIQRMHA
ncbi:hypothetical protein D3C84_1175350 [compost metagenome]